MEHDTRPNERAGDGSWIGGGVAPGKVTRTASLQRRDSTGSASVATAPAAEPIATAAPDPFWFASGPAAAASDALVVADDAVPGPAQMTQSAFLAALEKAVVATATSVLPPTWSADECPDLRAFFARQRNADPAAVDRLVRRYAGGTPGSAIECVALACDRLRPALVRWAGGQAMSWTIDTNGLPDALGQDLAAEPPTLASLGPAQPLDAATASRMADVFGGAAGAVQMHASPAATRHVRDLGVDAIAIGSHVAFAEGAYRPGTPEGDRLIAHELGHVAQQQGTEAAALERAPIALAAAPAAEADADRMADLAVARLHGGATGAPLAPAVTDAPAVRGGCLRPKVDEQDRDDRRHDGGHTTVDQVLRTVSYELKAGADAGYAKMTCNGELIADISTVCTTSGLGRANAWYTNYYNPTSDRGGKSATALLYIIACAAINNGATHIEISNANSGFEDSFAVPLGFAPDTLSTGNSDLVGLATTVRDRCQAVAQERGYQLPDPSTFTAACTGSFDQLRT